MNLAGWGRSSRMTPWLALVGAACASSPTVAPTTSIRLDAPPAATTSAPLPSLPPMTGGASIADTRAPRLRELDASDQDFTAVVRVLADRFGMQYAVDPSVKARVNTSLRNKTLPEALDAIMPLGVSYQIQNNVIRVGPARMETRMFSMDYVALARVGTASTVIQRRLGAGAIGGSGSNTGGGFNAANGGGADLISGVSVADVWEDVRVAVEAFTFDAAASGAGASQAAAQAAAGGAAASGLAGGRPYSRTAPDGRRMIVNPMAGQITVTAMPNRLEQIEFFIKSFEASIQRQVLIEAKIVEVSLDRSSEFGIDWNVVATSQPASNTFTPSSGTFSPGAGRTGSNIQITLNGGGARINAVLTSLESQGDVRVLSSPRVSALNNQRAVFDVTTGEIVFTKTTTQVIGPGGTAQPQETVTPTQVNVGIVLDVLPQISADNVVTMNIRPVVTSVARTATFTSGGSVFQAPVIDTRESDTMARLRGGETIIIGGLMQNRTEKVTSGVPVLRSIPLLGRLFTRTVNIDRKAELVIFLTPTIISGSPPASR
jgi:MSHA biogenesis protein MshL